MSLEDQMRREIARYREMLHPELRQTFDAVIVSAAREILGVHDEPGHAGILAAPAAAAPRAATDAADRPSRRRNPRIFCEELYGTWIHGSHHTCPRWTRR
jgi:hypothetical protein